MLQYRQTLLLFIILAIPLFLCQTPALGAAGQKLTVEGYRFDLTADQTGTKLRVRGTVSGGKDANLLSATIYLVDDANQKTRVRVCLDKYHINDKFHVQKQIKMRGSRWRVSNISIRRQ